MSVLLDGSPSSNVSWLSHKVNYAYRDHPCASEFRSCDCSNFFYPSFLLATEKRGNHSKKQNKEAPQLCLLE